MAGRPRTKARRVRQLDENMRALANEFSSLMPEACRDYQRFDAIGLLWSDASDAVTGASKALDELLSELEDRLEPPGQPEIVCPAPEDEIPF